METGFKSHQVEKMEFPLLQRGSVIRVHEKGLANQSFSSLSIVDPSEADNEQVFARQLTTVDQCYFLRGFPFGLQPAASRFREAFGKFTRWVDPQLTAQPLGSHNPADGKPLIFSGFLGELGVGSHGLQGMRHLSIMAPRLPLDCMASAAPILPGATVTVVDQRSIYNGYTGFVQRISGDRAAVLFEGGNWDKLVTLRIKDLSAD